MAGPVTPTPGSRRAPLVALYAADTISLSGNAVSQLAIPWFVLITTGSPALTGVAVFLTFLPVVLAGLFGGVVVDRLGFRTTSVTADLASAVAVAAIPLIHSSVGIELWQLFTLVFVGALLDAPGNTARAALFPDLVRLADVRLERASGIRGAIQRSSLLLGAPLGGVLVASFGATTALWLNAASFLFSAALIATLVPVVRATKDAEAPKRYLGELAEGLRFIWSRRLIRAIVLTVLVTNFLDAPFGVLMPVFVREAFGSAAYLGLLYGIFGGFALAGSLVFSAIGHRLPRRLTFVSCFSVMPLMYLVLSTLPSLPVAMVALAAAGLAVGPINPLLGTLQFERVPAELRGRVFGAIQAGAWGAIPAGVLLGGALAGTIGVGWTFLGIAACYALVTAYGFVNPAFREMDDRPESLDGTEAAERASSMS